MSDDKQHERATADDDAKEDLELKDEDADQVRGGLKSKVSEASTDQLKEKW